MTSGWQDRVEDEGCESYDATVESIAIRDTRFATRSQPRMSTLIRGWDQT
jgi:hypothetical protein